MTMSSRSIFAAVMASEPLASSIFGDNGTAFQLKAAECCGTLSQHDTLGARVTYPNATLYEDRLGSYYSANAALPPWCMVLPLSTEDVSLVAQIISEHECPFGMRSGGHAAFTGSNSVREGITIDFGYMNATRYDENTKIASIQPGSNWGQVYTALDAYDVTVAGGRADVVGVGGFTTGGGYSFHSGTTGWACDNVYGFEVVLSNGSIIDVNEEQNADLFQAMKGSSGNLALITRVDMYAIDSSEIWGGYVTYNLSDRAAVFDAYYDFAENFGKDPASQTLIMIAYSDGNLGLRSIPTNTDAKVAPPAFEKYTAIHNLTDSTTVASIADLVPEFTGVTPLGVYSNWFTGSVSNAVVADFLEFYYQAILEYIPEMEAAITHNSSLSMVCNLQPVPQAFVNHSIEKGGNIMGLEGLVEDGPLQSWLIAVTVTKEADQPPVLKLAKNLVSTLENYATSLGGNKGWHYLNYAHEDQDPIAGYGEENIAKLKAASAKYDPHGVFQNLRHSGFKIPLLLGSPGYPPLDDQQWQLKCLATDRRTDPYRLHNYNDATQGWHGVLICRDTSKYDAEQTLYR